MSLEVDAEPHSSASMYALPPIAQRRTQSDHNVRENTTSRSYTSTFYVANESKSAQPGSKQTLLYKNPTLRARVPRNVLEGGTAPPFRRRLISRIFRSLRPTAAVKVEPLESGLSASVLYAPELVHDSLPPDTPFIPTTLVSNRPRADDKNIVYQDSPFEIRVSGMLARNFDRWGPSGDNELLMYSIQTDPSTTGDTNMSLPFIHYDFQRDGSKNTEQPNTYIPIPASKSYVMSSPGRPHHPRTTSGAAAQTAARPDAAADYPGLLPNNRTPQSVGVTRQKGGTSKTNGNSMKSWPKKSVNVQFRILEMDNPSETIKQAVNGIDELGGFVSSFSSTAPFLGVLSPALGLASSVSKRALDSYAQPDKVISIDMDFLLADRKRVREGTASPGEYLRYGYYFFLSEPIEGRLYASVRTPKNVQLMFRRCDTDHNRKSAFQGDTVVSRRFFPLTEVSYLVVRVVEPTGAGRLVRHPIQMSHAHQLENIFSRAKLHDDPKAICNALWDLGRELGAIEESDGENDADDAVADGNNGVLT